jgi:hypothetical protein
MLNTPYQQTVSTLVDYTILRANNLIIVAAATTAVRTLTLPLARESDDVYIFNQSLYPVLIVAQSGDTNRGTGIVAAGAMVHFQAASQSLWFSFGGGAGVGAAQSVAVSLSSAQILALNATPVTLIPAPGAGRVILVNDITMQMTRTGTAYSNGGALEFRYTDGSGAKVSADIAAALVTTGGAGVAYASVLGIEASITPVVNSPVVVDNASAAFITGTGTAKLSIAYRIADFN